MCFNVLFYFTRIIVLTILQNHFFSNMNIGVAFSKIEEFNESLKYLDQAINLKPDNADVWNDKGTVFLMMKNHQKAIYCFDEALKHKPTYAVAYSNRGLALKYLERYDEAIDNFHIAMKYKRNYFINPRKY